MGTGMMHRRLLATCTVLGGLLGCGIAPDPTWRFMPALEPFDPSQGGWRQTRPLLLVADCQVHNLYSLPIPDRNLSIERMAGTAIRPPQLDMFAPDVLRWILEENADGAEAILHLGDALDLACDGELRQFLSVMNGAGKPWLVVPGNHECYHLGTYDPRNQAVWKDACHGAGESITKDRWVRLYVSAIIAQDDPGAAALAEDLNLGEDRQGDVFERERLIPDQHSWEAAEGADGFLDAIVWSIDVERPWRSFVLQRANVSGGGPQGIPARIILMDSCQYGELPGLVPNAWDNYLPELNCGYTGEILSDQLRLVRTWVESMPDIVYVLACHHPLEG